MAEGREEKNGDLYKVIYPMLKTTLVSLSRTGIARTEANSKLQISEGINRSRYPQYGMSTHDKVWAQVLNWAAYM